MQAWFLSKRTFARDCGEGRPRTNPNRRRCAPPSVSPPDWARRQLASSPAFPRSLETSASAPVITAAADAEEKSVYRKKEKSDQCRWCRVGAARWGRGAGATNGFASTPTRLLPFKHVPNCASAAALPSSGTVSVAPAPTALRTSAVLTTSTSQLSMGIVTEFVSANAFASTERDPATR
jgi:hypothetical protein